MVPLLSSTKLIIIGVLVAIAIGVWVYIASLQNSIETKDTIIATQKTEIVVDQKSDIAHDLGATLEIFITKEKGDIHAFEINDSIGIHRIDFE